MKLTEVKRALNAFGKYVIQQARTNLTKGKKNFSKGLYESLDYNIDDVGAGMNIIFEMEDYGMYQDRGVKGTRSGRSLSGFKYKESSNLIGLEYHTGIFSKWARSKGLQPRDKKGRFGSYKSMGYILARSIKEKGIKPSLFFTKPFEKGLKRLPPDIQKALQKDLEEIKIL
jgi:hypothetical protein